jgi:hypothetical protein
MTSPSPETRNPNLFGETLRERYFTKGEGKGCYENFTLEKEFVAAALGDRAAILRAMLDAQLLPVGQIADTQIFTRKDDPNMFAAWFWDGDGMLVVSDGVRTAYNADCKKSHGWSFADLDVSKHRSNPAPMEF